MSIDQMTKTQRMAALDRATGMARITERVRDLCQARYETTPRGGVRVVEPPQRRGVCIACGRPVRRGTILGNRRRCTTCGGAYRQLCGNRGRLAEATPHADPIITADHLDAFLARFTGDYACEY
jgi:hypothetical protein